MCQPILTISIDTTTISFASFQYLLKNGIIDTADVLEKAQEMKKQELINMNPWKMYQGKDSVWYVYLPSEDNPKQRGKRVKRKDKMDLEDFLADYWKEKLMLSILLYTFFSRIFDLCCLLQ